MIAHLSFVASLLMASVLLTQSSRAEEYHFASISELYEQQVGAIIVSQIYKKLGIKISITPMPGERAMLETVSGRMDGEIMRIGSYGDEYLQVIRIPTPYYHLETMAFYKKDSGIVIGSAADLAKHSVLKVRGVKHTNNITAGLSNVYDYDDTESMLKALDKDRNNVALTHTEDGLFAIEKYHIEQVDHLGKPLLILPLYHYVHKKNAHLVEKVDRIIREMKDSGELRTLIRLAEKKVFQLHGLPFQ
jgi:polar amino acid transport system substrate-binding protein